MWRKWADERGVVNRSPRKFDVGRRGRAVGVVSKESRFMGWRIRVDVGDPWISAPGPETGTNLPNQMNAERCPRSHLAAPVTKDLGLCLLAQVAQTHMLHPRPFPQQNAKRFS
jgi:hypothetical protein